MTAFKLTDEHKNRFNRLFCIYDENDTEVSKEEATKQLEEDAEYFFQLISHSEDRHV